MACPRLEKFIQPETAYGTSRVANINRSTAGVVQDTEEEALDIIVVIVLNNIEHKFEFRPRKSYGFRSSVTSAFGRIKLRSPLTAFL